MPIAEGPGELAMKMVADMERLTHYRIGDLGLGNAEKNLPHIATVGQSLAALRDETVGEGDSAIVIAAGPSIRKHDPIKWIKESGYKGAIIATESAISYCLRNGVVPDLTVTLDPHASRIVRWFGDPHLTEESLAADDYFRRQDMDTAFADELRLNREILDMLDKHGHSIRIAVSSSASQAVVNRVVEAGMRVFWWNPMYDDPDQPDSVTRKLYQANSLPCVNAGGNVGTTCWMMAHAVLGKKHVAVTGMDFGYYGDTPYYNTQYYHELVALVGKEKLDSVFIRMRNPHLDQEFYTDPAYMWYRQAFLDLVQDADCQTYNCTEGGILFGEGVETLPLKEFLGRFS